MKNISNISKIILLLLLVASCAKDEIVIPPLDGSGYEYSQGLHFKKTGNLQADKISFKLRRNTTEYLGEFGASLKRPYNVIDLSTGFHVLYNVKLFNEGESVDFKSYIIEDGNRIEVIGTSIINIKKGKVLTIFLEQLQ